MITQDTVLRESHFHLLGVGGMGMAPLALFLKQAGCRITGQDDNFHPRVEQLLVGNGIEIEQDPDFQSTESIIYSNAIGITHPTLVEAGEKGVEVIRRGEFLASLSNRFKTVAVAGSHGKTTTCGLLIHALKTAGFPCNYILGGLFSGDDQLPGHFQDESPWLVIEVDESDGSIRSFEPTISLLVNVDWDHADFHHNQKKCTDAFLGLVQRTKEDVFLNQSCENSSELDLSGIQAKVHLFGESQIVDFSDRTLQLGDSLPSCSLQTPFDERFNAQNAVAALSVLNWLGGEINSDILAGFPGLWRRQEVLYENEGLTVIEDYGHHPTEIRNLLDALRVRKGPLSVVFQPHRFSRTLQFKHEFAEVLSSADLLLIMEVYGAGEQEIEGGRGNDLFEECTQLVSGPESHFCGDHQAVMNKLTELKLHSGVLLFLGAGNIQEVAADYVACLKDQKIKLDDDFVSEVTGRFTGDTLIRVDEPLANKTTIRLGGSADFFAEPANETDLRILLQGADRFSLPIHFLGRGSNVIVPDSGVRGLVIRLSKPIFQQVEILEDGRIRVGAGVRLKELCGFTRKHSVAGFEFLEGIPGNVGGALRMNAGAMGGWISEVISEVVLMNFQGDITTVSVEDLHLGHRHCRELFDSIGLAVIFKPGDASTLQSIQHTMDTYQSTRKESQPRLPSAGCSFKNPNGSAAGKLIDQSGLKGFSVGGAEVSDIHANFIVNSGNATASDVIFLINQLRKKVYQKTGYELDPEVILFGDKWENYLHDLPKESCTTQPFSQG